MLDRIMDIDSEITPTDMDREMVEESMSTDMPDLGQATVSVDTSSTSMAATSVSMTTGNGEMLEEDEDNRAENDMDPSSESDLTSNCNSLNSTTQMLCPVPGTIKNYKTFSKMILSPGFGFAVPKDGTVCNVNIFVLNLNSVPTEDIGYEVGNSVVLMVGEGDTMIARQIDLCMQTMKEGEVCDIQIPITTSSNPNEVCSFRIHLMSFQDSISSWQLLPGEKISRAAHHKEKGTALFQQGNIEFAFYRFSKALKYLVCCYPEDSVPENLQETFLQLKCQCYSNMAACQMKHNNYVAVIENCSKALEVEAENLKALYRRGQAYFYVGNYDLARSDMLQVSAVEPQNKAVLQMLAQLDAKQKQEDGKMAAGLSKMFS